MAQNTQTPSSKWNNYIREKANEVSIIDTYWTTQRAERHEKLNVWRDFLLHVVCHLCHCCVFLEDLITFMPEFRKLWRARRTLCVLQACAFMSVSVWLTWPVLLEPEASGSCWEQMMMTDMIDSVVGRRTGWRRRATTSIEPGGMCVFEQERDREGV